MERFRLYGNGWRHLKSDYSNWDDSVTYSFDRNKHDNDKSGEIFQYIW